MSGQMLITSPDAGIARHERARFTFTDGGSDLRFDDQRTFGHLMYDDGGTAARIGYSWGVRPRGPRWGS